MRSAKSPSAECRVGNAESGGRGSKSDVQRSKFKPRRPAAVAYLWRFLCAGFVLAFLVAGCAGPRPLKGGKAIVTRTPGGSVQHILTQSENPAQATKQEQESVKVRTFVVPAGSRMQASPAVTPGASSLHTLPPHPSPLCLGGGEGGRRPGGRADAGQESVGLRVDGAIARHRWVARAVPLPHRLRGPARPEDKPRRS